LFCLFLLTRDGTRLHVYLSNNVFYCPLSPGVVEGGG
jgi:hypothetical protein